MSEIVKPKNRFQRGPQTRATADSFVDRYPDLKAERDRALKTAGCCTRNDVMTKYETLARSRAGQG